MFYKIQELCLCEHLDCSILYYANIFLWKTHLENRPSIGASQYKTAMKQDDLQAFTLVARISLKSCPKNFQELPKSCFLSTQKNPFLQVMKVNLCTSIRIIYLIFKYSFLLTNISIPTEMIFQSLQLCILFYISLWESVLNIGYSPSRKIMLFNIQ